MDYARVIVSALWKRLDPESIVKNKEKVFIFKTFVVYFLMILF